MNKYQVYFEGNLFVYAESEDEAIQKADDVINGDARVHLDHDYGVDNIEVIDCEEVQNEKTMSHSLFKNIA